MKAKDFDEKFDKGEDIIKGLHVSKRYSPQQEQKSIHVDFPQWLIQRLTKGARPNKGINSLNICLWSTLQNCFRCFIEKQTE
jgi:hypothetical protein